MAKQKKKEKQKKLSPEDTKILAAAIKEHKEVSKQVGPLNKRKDELTNIIKEKIRVYGRDFDLPTGSTRTSPGSREGYDTLLLDEMIENGTFDADTAALIRRARYKRDTFTTYVR